VNEDWLDRIVVIVAHLFVAGEDQALQVMLIRFQVEG
jgi:hypothetical protein